MDMTKLKVNSKLIVNKGLTKNEKLSNFVKDK